MTMSDFKREMGDANLALTPEFRQEIIEKMLAQHSMHSTDICYQSRWQNMDHDAVNSDKSIDIYDLAQTVLEMKKKVDVLAENFAFLFTPLDKAEQD